MTGKHVSLAMNNEAQLKQEIAALTRLAAAQIRVTVSESGESVDNLTEAFTDIVDTDRQIRETVERLPNEPEIQELKGQIAALSRTIGTNVQNAIIAFQFFDRLCQRLDHTCSCLQKISGTSSSDLQVSVDELLSLRDSIYKQFTMEEERILFDAVLNSDDIDSALEAYYEARKNAIEEQDEEE